MREPKWTVGQAVVVRTHGWRKSEPTQWSDATITKVGRKWVSFRYNDSRQEHRFDHATGAVDAGQFMTRSWVYADRGSAEAELLRQATWNALRAAMSRAHGPAPRDLTIAQMQEIARTLGLRLEVSNDA